MMWWEFQKIYSLADCVWHDVQMFSVELRKANGVLMPPNLYDRISSIEERARQMREVSDAHLREWEVEQRIQSACIVNGMCP
jgi:hypothetical protein